MYDALSFSASEQSRRASGVWVNGIKPESLLIAPLRNETKIATIHRTESHIVCAYQTDDKIALDTVIHSFVSFSFLLSFRYRHDDDDTEGVLSEAFVSRRRGY